MLRKSNAELLRLTKMSPESQGTGKKPPVETTALPTLRISGLDITVPFWSMPENTDHPTQKPEKLIAKLVLASSQQDSVVFDPFLGSGTTSVVAKKLGWKFVGVEIDERFCCLVEKRLAMATFNGSIQGYHDGAFWERNSLAEQGAVAK